MLDRLPPLIVRGWIGIVWSTCASVGETPTVSGSSDRNTTPILKSS
ncbi:MAG: hypothetical protein ACXAAH_11875 [Promethearchaeota archaeon]